MAENKTPEKSIVVGSPEWEAEQEGHRRGKRLFFTSLLKPFAAMVKGYDLPDGHTSANPPQNKKVIRAGANAQVLALLGPLSRGELVAGYRLFEVKILVDSIDVIYEKAGQKLRVILAAVESDVGVQKGQSDTFRIAVDGDAPEADRELVSERVAREVIARDRGQLWVIAAAAPSAPAPK